MGIRIGIKDNIIRLIPRRNGFFFISYYVLYTDLSNGKLLSTNFRNARMRNRGSKHFQISTTRREKNVIVCIGC